MFEFSLTGLEKKTKIIELDSFNSDFLYLNDRK